MTHGKAVIQRMQQDDGRMAWGAQATKRSRQPARPQAALGRRQGLRSREQARLQGRPAERVHEGIFQL